MLAVKRALLAIYMAPLFALLAYSEWRYERQVERDADIYMTRVSDFLAYTPFVYLRAHRGSLPHDSDAAATAEVAGLR